MSKKESLNIAIEERPSLSKGGRKQLRRDGYLPASISSKGEDSISITIRRDTLLRAIDKFGRMSVFNLKLGKKTYNCMVKEMQHAPLTQECLHVTFQHIDLTEETTAEVAIRPIGRESVQRRRLDFLQIKDYLSIKGLPNDIPNSIDVDVTEMEAGDVLNVGDLVLPEGITTDEDPDDVVFTVSHERVAEEEETEEAAEGEVAVEAADTEEEAE
ncbi:MAG: 50S ribosomal protein L25 [Christensenellaceae bacterium]|nr:50S ribosomal protein L25 [Christensenellaceae bacterium]